jgi:alanine dehydrogenase
MQIGIPKERKTDERRVALRPDQAAAFVARGHKVFVETGAGRLSGFEDGQYAMAGAGVVPTAQEVFNKARLIIKVKCPLESEYSLLTGEHVLFTFLHFDENIKAANITRIVNTGVTAIAYEWVETGGRFPLLQPMSELTGAVFARKSMALLMEHRGLLGGSYLEQWPAATAMVIGCGHIGANAVNVFAKNHFRILLVDKHPETVKERLGRYVKRETVAGADMDVITFDEKAPAASIHRIRSLLPKTDIVICAAVRRQSMPPEMCRYILSRADIAMMREGSVVCDATACDRDLVETCVSSESLTHTYIDGGAVHYNCDHVPSLVAATATRVLTDATMPYIEMLAGGIETALDNPAIAKGVMCIGGRLTHEYSARKKQLEYMPLSQAIESSFNLRRGVCATF